MGLAKDRIIADATAKLAVSEVQRVERVNKKAVKIVSDMLDITEEILNKHTIYGGRAMECTVREDMVEELKQGLEELQTILGGKVL